VRKANITAYGRKLDIQRGRLIFSGGPVDDPGWDIRAIKQFRTCWPRQRARHACSRRALRSFSEPRCAVADIVFDPGGRLVGTVQNRQTQ